MPSHIAVKLGLYCRDEPPDPYIFLTPDNPAYRDIGAARRSKSDKGEDAWNDDFKPNDDVKPSERME